MDGKGYEKIYIAPGYTDMRKSIDGLKQIIGRDLKLDPYQKKVLFLFCGRNSSKMKALEWEGDGFVMSYKRVEDGRYNWPRTPGEAVDLTQEQFERLMKGFSIESTIKEIEPKRIF